MVFKIYVGVCVRRSVVVARNGTRNERGHLSVEVDEVLRRGATFSFVRIQDMIVELSLEHAGQFPGQVGGIMYAGVHSLIDMAIRVSGLQTDLKQ